MDQTVFAVNLFALVGLWTSKLLNACAQTLVHACVSGKRYKVLTVVDAASIDTLHGLTSLVEMARR